MFGVNIASALLSAFVASVLGVSGHLTVPVTQSEVTPHVTAGYRLVNFGPGRVGTMYPIDPYLAVHNERDGALVQWFVYSSRTVVGMPVPVGVSTYRSAQTIRLVPSLGLALYSAPIGVANIQTKAYTQIRPGPGAITLPANPQVGYEATIFAEAFAPGTYDLTVEVGTHKAVVPIIVTAMPKGARIIGTDSVGIYGHGMDIAPHIDAEIEVPLASTK